jgi:hypothetical protein
LTVGAAFVAIVTAAVSAAMPECGDATAIMLPSYTVEGDDQKIASLAMIQINGATLPHGEKQLEELIGDAGSDTLPQNGRCYAK